MQSKERISEYGQIAVQGPNARAMVQKHVEEDISDIKMFEFRTDFKVDGKGVILSQTGYTGEDDLKSTVRAKIL